MESDDIVSHFYPKIISIALKFDVSMTWHFLGLIEMWLCPVNFVMNSATSSFEQEAGRQTPQWTFVELFIWKRFHLSVWFTNSDHRKLIDPARR